jgi:RNA polymerase sigma-70 factor (ECF subfamily)
VIGVEAALARLYGQRPRLLAYVDAIVADRDLAEDVLQELALLMVRKLPALEGEVEGLDRWLRRAARFLALNAARRAASARHRPLDESTLDLLEAHWDAQAAAADGMLPALRACLDELPRHARSLLERRYIDEWSPGAESARTGLSVNALYQRLGRLHRALGDCVRARLARGG